MAITGVGVSFHRQTCVYFRKLRRKQYGLPIWGTGVVIFGGGFLAFLFFTTKTGVYNKVYCAINGKLWHKPGQSDGGFFGGFEKQITKGIHFGLNRTVDISFSNC